MTDTDATWDVINDAWDVLYDSLPPRWKIGRPSYDPGRQTWSVTAWGPRGGSSKRPPSVTGSGDDEAAALRDLDRLLRGLPNRSAANIDELGHLVRLAFVDGAEALAMECLGRRLTPGELGRVIGRYGGR